MHSHPFWSQIVASSDSSQGVSSKRLMHQAGLLKLCAIVGGLAGDVESRRSDSLCAGSFRSALSGLGGGRRADTVTALDQSDLETAHRWPYFLPDGRHFLYLCAAAGLKAKGYTSALLMRKKRSDCFPLL
jgi:hypothetical protein